MRIIFVFLFLSLTANVFAQVALGVKGGLNQTQYTQGFLGFNRAEAFNSVTFGAFGRVGVLGAFVQPELNYVHQGINIAGIGRKQLHHLEVPFLVGYSALEVFRVNAGPAFHYLIHQNEINRQSVRDLSQLQRRYWSVQLGAGLDIGKFVADVRFDFTLWRQGTLQFVDADNQPLFNRNPHINRLVFTVGYRFL
jgi:hypothetical protein